MAECFNSWIKADGSTDFPPEANRYHLYIGYSCPFAARPFTVWKLKGLETVISINFTDPFKLPNETWKFSPEKDSCTADEVNGFSGLKEVYLKADPNFKGKISVPLLWDKKTGTAVNNDSVEIMRMLNSEFNAFCPTKEQRSIDLRPSDLQDKMEDINAWVGKINFGVYVAGLAPNQQRYDEKVEELFQYLDKAEDILSRQRYLLGDKMTETDIRLFTTLVRFDVVYHGLFKCNKKRIADCPSLQGFLCDIYQTGGIADTVNMNHIKIGYWGGFVNLNPSGILPIGPIVDFNAPHDRDTKAY